MFTGIIERVGRVAEIRREGGTCVLEIDAGEDWAREVRLGASVAVDGCCLTVAAVRDGRLVFEAVPETLERTALGDRRSGGRVHLERALAAGGRLDGHLVQGHVDGCGVVDSLDRQQEDVRLRVTCTDDLARYLVPKGSVAIDGVSLTVVEASSSGFSVVLIPHTLAETRLGELEPGDRVNVEVDVVGKYVYQYLERQTLIR